MIFEPRQICFNQQLKPTVFRIRCYCTRLHVPAWSSLLCWQSLSDLLPSYRSACHAGRSLPQTSPGHQTAEATPPPRTALGTAWTPAAPSTLQSSTATGLCLAHVARVEGSYYASHLGISPAHILCVYMTWRHKHCLHTHAGGMSKALTSSSSHAYLERCQAVAIAGVNGILASSIQQQRQGCQVALPSCALQGAPPQQHIVHARAQHLPCQGPSVLQGFLQ
jgi:hypothetical protein